MASYEDYGEDWETSERQREGATRDAYKERERSQGRDRHRERDHGSERSDREHDSDRHRRRSDDRDRSHDRDRKSRDRSRDRDRRHHDHDGERRHRHRTRSLSRGRSRDRSRSRSQSRDRRSKRTSGFDMAPPGAAVIPGVALPGQLAGVSQAMPAVMPGAFPFAGTQFGTLSTVPMQAMTQQATRHARRVYVGGLPPFANEQTIATFFSQVMAAIGGNTAGPGDAVVNVYINHEKKFAFVEMRTVEEASNAMALDGIVFEGLAVRVRRPSDYNPSLAATLGPSQPSPHLNLAAVGLTPGACSASGGADGPDKIFVGGLPYYLTETQIKELLESFGPLRGFDLVKDWETGNSKGYAFCVYQDSAVTDVACAALNGLKMGDKTLTVRRATASGQPKPDQSDVLLQAQQQIAMQKIALQAAGASAIAFGGLPGLMSGLSAGLAFGNGISATEVPTKVVCLNQLVSVDDLRDDKEFEDIYEDIKDECGKFGTVTNLIIPRPQSTGEEVPGLGKAFVEYSDTEGSSKAKISLHQRKFAGNSVIATYYPEDKFARGELDG